jgi:putative glutamine amidotransferase
MTEPQRRPLIAIPARFSAAASALRFRAEVVARALAEAVFEAGGEPLTLHPHAPGGVIDVPAVSERLWMADGVLLPGGGDVAAHWSGSQTDESMYDVDSEQDAFDFAVFGAARARGLPVLAICRGSQVVNVALGGDLVLDMETTVGHHRNRTHEFPVAAGSLLAATLAPVRPGASTREPDPVRVSCYHHQCLGRLGTGVTAVAHAEDGTVEAISLDGSGWFLGLQWHPEDTAATDTDQAQIFRAFVEAARN